VTSTVPQCKEVEVTVRELLRMQESDFYLDRMFKAFARLGGGGGEINVPASILKNNDA
jgi:hypothetical protein